VVAKLTKIPSDYVNVRSLPDVTGADVGDLRLGEVVTYFPNALRNGWVYIKPGTGSPGWVSLQNGAVQFTPVVEPPDPEPPVLAREGIDVSQAQANPDWDRVAADGVGYVIARATQGIAISTPVGLDTRFHSHIQGATAAGIPVGVYHTFIPKRDGNEQADFFYSVIEPYLDTLALPPAIDVEVEGEETKATIADRLHTMAVRLTTRIGQKPMIYTAPGFWNTYVGTQWDSYFASLPLWVAHWTGNAQPLLPRGWTSYKLWQFSNNASVDGITGRVDMNRLA
jgi:GH25 family lysozyme M1 (1,4-beta-N-acetylmuramidase)